ncbi:hypothetical protein [Nocardia jejuensis]|uniref:hypothetical protein n=1 Tax=Nocardia jejuensis TaxID=328049 RepID=UPI00082F5DF9|nr:hypothetical protein [Nocardia jejuensis]
MRRTLITAFAGIALTGLAATGVAHADPATTLHEGTQVVGQDVQPGLYHTAGPREEDYGSCFITWLPYRGAKSSELIDIQSFTGASDIRLNDGDVVDISGCRWALA